MTPTSTIVIPLIAAVVLGVSFAILIVIPDKWDKATVLKVCSGVPVLQLEDRTIWLRGRWRAYRVEGEKWRELC